MINRYRNYLKILDEKLSGMFQKQKAFIKCKEGCAYCCSEGEYPMSELEYINIMFAYENLEPKIKSKVDKNIKSLMSKSDVKLFACPFLINNSCSVYEARALICRAFGLLTFYKDEKQKMPFCVDLGLNYSNAINPETNMLEIIAPDGTEPVSFNVDRRTLRSKNIEQDFNIIFGEDKSLYAWLEEDFSQ